MRSAAAPRGKKAAATTLPTPKTSRTQKAGESAAERAPASSALAASGMRARTAGCRSAGGLGVGSLGDGGADGGLQERVRIREQTLERRVTLRDPPDGGPVALAQGGVEQGTHHRDAERASHGPEKDHGGGRDPAPPPGHGALDATAVAPARAAAADAHRP